MFTSRTEDEKDFLNFMSRQKDVMSGDFSVRLERAVKRLVRDSKKEGLEQTRVAVSEALHVGLFQQLRVLLGRVLAGKTRVAVLIDNLDKLIKQYLTQTILPRPRDIVYLVKEAVSTAVNRSHSKVEEDDLLSAEKQYSHYAFDSILVENGITVPQLEKLLYEFAGKHYLVSEDEVLKCIENAGLPAQMRGDLIDHLIKLTFLGPEVDENRFTFSEDPKELKKAQILSEKLARQLKRKRRFKIHPAFHSFLDIN